MTVGELISKLQGCPTDIPVMIGEIPGSSDEDMGFRQSVVAQRATMQCREGVGASYEAFCILPEVPETSWIDEDFTRRWIDDRI